MNLRELLRAVVPGAVVVLAAVAALAMPDRRAALASFLLAYPWLLPAAIVGLAVAFRRGRVALVAVALAAAGDVLARLQGPLAAGEPVGSYALATLAVLLPAVIGAVALLPERSLASAGGALRLAALAGVGGLAALAWLAYWPALVEAPQGRLVAIDTASRTAVPQPGLALFLLAFGAVLVALLRTAGPVEGSLLWVLVAAYRALADGGTGEVPVIFLAAGGMALLVGLVQASAATAYRDPLTGIPGRRALDEALAALAGRYTLAVVDVDHFKKFNDTHGHDVGDQVLRMVAARLAAVGGGGKAFRHGGEEFALLFPGKTMDACVHHLEAVRKGIAGADFTLRAPDRPRRRPKAPASRPKDAPRLTLTVSIGAAERGATLRKVEEVLRAADTALYRAKQGGRNRVAT